MPMERRTAILAPWETARSRPISVRLGFQSEDGSGIILDTNGRLIAAGTATSSGSSYSDFAVSCYDPGMSSLSVQTQYDPPALRIVVPDQVTSAGTQLNLSPLAMFSCDISPSNGTYTYSVDWGDGTIDSPTGTVPSQGGGSLYVGSFGDSHTYTATGVYTVAATVSVTTTGGTTFSTAIMQVTVDSTTALLTTSIPPATVNAGQTCTLPNIAFTGLGVHTATVNWGDTTTDNATVTEPYENDALMATVPGSIADSHVYSTAGSYQVTVTLTDDSGNPTQPAPLLFTITVTSADVALTNFSTAGNMLQVQYNIANPTNLTQSAAQFQIGIYSSADGTTPDQLLTSYMVGGVNASELTVGNNHTVLLAPPAGALSGDYYLVAVADSDATPNDNALVLGGEPAPSTRR